MNAAIFVHFYKVQECVRLLCGMWDVGPAVGLLSHKAENAQTQHKPTHIQWAGGLISAR